MNQLLVALRFYATGSFQLVVGDTFSIDNSTVCRTLHKVSRAIAKLMPKYVTFPTTPVELNKTMQLFYNVSKLPGVIGAIDCTHVPIQSPGAEDGEVYRNRKGYFSINVQLVCDATGFITNAVIRWPGSVHDSTIFDNCHLRGQLETSQISGYLVGDGGYACRRYLLTPLLNPVTAADKKFNDAQTSARNIIERTNGMLKRRFPCLKYGLRLKLENTLSVIAAVVVLHNIAVTLVEEEPDDDKELDEFIAARRQEGLHVDYDAVEVSPPVLANERATTSMRQAVIDSHFN